MGRADNFTIILRLIQFPAMFLPISTIHFNSMHDALTVFNSSTVFVLCDKNAMKVELMLGILKSQS